MLISDLCIQRPVFAIVINLILALLGIYALDHLSIRQLPAMDFPMSPSPRSIRVPPPNRWNAS
ncbi:efflux RND transporter permease subunit [Tistrella bauzanensis]